MQSLKSVGNYLMRELSHSNVQHFSNSSKVLFAFCSNCRDKSLSKEFVLSAEDLDCLRVDFSSQDYDLDRYSPTIRNQNEEFLREISVIKPEVIFVDHIQESQYLMQTKGTLRTLGYTGHLSGLKKGRGLGIFVRKDVAESLRDASVSVSGNISKMFDPL
ncbi:uncharacterized protein LOC133186309 [Saccostrea echinata]|uniref:uncharacterized protein LOC133186309 n=1 Tax=Saccostrea echinata TaxID=191078 RepID=UPI002A81270F|nr:uncharacterized protein LOC133186309 [Saccostrea echinata]